MKYLKSFNESEKFEYYIEVDRRLNFGDSINKLTFNEIEFNYISKLINKYRRKLTNLSIRNHGRLIRLSFECEIENLNKYQIIDIIKISDEYYFIYFTFSGLYKCDQLEGLKKCIDDKIGEIV